MLSLFAGCCATAGKAGSEYKNLIKSYEDDHNFKRPEKGTVPVNGGISSDGCRGKGIPVLAYHCIDDSIFGVKSLFVSPAVFDRQMKYLKESGYTPVTFRDIERLSRSGNNSRLVMITFDDGYENNYIHAYPILKKYGFKATVFLITGFIEKTRFLTAAEIKKMSDLIDFEDHTASHPHLTKLPPDSVNREFTKSIESIEKLTGRKAIAAAYPYGDYDNNVEAIAKKYFKYAVTVKFGLYHLGSDDDLAIHRINISDSTDMDAFRRLLGV